MKEMRQGGPMKLSLKLFSYLAALLSAGMAPSPQTPLPTETRNAAVVYREAMADLPDPLPDNLLGVPLGQTEAGLESWDEAKLGPILDANIKAIEELERAAKLPECDWGPESSRSAHGYVPFSMPARVLARLNTLNGMRLMAKGQSEEALEAWLAGVKFARDIGRGGPVILQLVGHAALLPDLEAMTAAANAGKFLSQQKKQIAEAISDLQPDVFDWSAAYGLEETYGETFWNEVRNAKHPSAEHREIAGTPMPRRYKCPSEGEMVAFRALTEKAQAALQKSPADAESSILTLQDQIDRSQPSLAGSVPSLVKINEARARVVAARDALLKSVGG
jgi:hypothetical protein